MHHHPDGIIGGSSQLHRNFGVLLSGFDGLHSKCQIPKLPIYGTSGVLIGGTASFRSPTWVKCAPTGDATATGRGVYWIMPPRIAIGLLCALYIPAAQPGASVAEIVTLVRSAVAKHDADGALAK